MDSQRGSTNGLEGAPIPREKFLTESLPAPYHYLSDIRRTKSCPDGIVKTETCAFRYLRHFL